MKIEVVENQIKIFVDPKEIPYKKIDKRELNKMIKEGHKHIIWSPVSKLFEGYDFAIYNKNEKSWLLPPTYDNIFKLADFLKDKKVEYLNGAKQFLNYLSKQFLLIEKIKKDKIITKYYTNNPPPYEHQKIGTTLAIYLPRVAYFMEQGTGKTRIMIDAFCHLFSENEVRRVLIICPLSAIRSAWLNDIKKFATVKPLVLVLDKGSVKKRKEKLLNLIYRTSHTFFSFLSVVIINFDVVHKMLDVLKEFRPDMTIIDESHRIKNPKAKRTKAILELADYSKRRYILAGTPIINTPLDLYPQFKFLDKITFSYSLLEFRAKITADNEGKQLQKLVEAYSYKKSKKECLDLPDKVYKNIYLEMGSKQRKMYNKVKKEITVAIDEYEDIIIKATKKEKILKRIIEEYGDRIPPHFKYKFEKLLEKYKEERKKRILFISNLFVKLNKLSQITSGFVYSKDTIFEFENPKLKELEEIIYDHIFSFKKKLIIWARWIYDINKIAELCKRMKVHYLLLYSKTSKKADLIQKRFQEAIEPMVLIGHPLSGGLAVTLTAASDVIYYSLSYSPEQYWQSQDRCHRIGQEQKVTYLHFLMKGTIDENILKSLERKERIAKNILGFAKEVVKYKS
ncbi:MAG: DEAD/DEAH box helicase [Candidatus Desulfofervidus auxilii]|nr:DEAD/DEAH box helicase [Candidatus Desulfofervidus auxilii]